MLLNIKRFLFFILFPFTLFGQTQIGLDIDGEAASDNSGWSVSLSSDGKVVAIGTIANSESNGVVNSGHVRVYDLSAVLSVQNNTFGAGFLVYPNPVNSVINIEIQEVTNGNWQLINPLGQIIKESNFEASELKIRVQDLNSGMYFLKITDSEINQSITKRIIVSD